MFDSGVDFLGEDHRDIQQLHAVLKADLVFLHQVLPAEPYLALDLFIELPPAAPSGVYLHDQPLDRSVFRRQTEEALNHRGGSSEFESTLNLQLLLLRALGCGQDFLHDVDVHSDVYPGNRGIGQDAHDGRLLELSQNLRPQPHLGTTPELAVAQVVEHLRQDRFIDQRLRHVDPSPNRAKSLVGSCLLGGGRRQLKVNQASGKTNDPEQFHQGFVIETACLAGWLIACGGLAQQQLSEAS